MGLVAAKCTQCGANIEVDASKEAGVCSHCGTAFITEKVINNYTIHNHNTVNNNIAATINVKKGDGVGDLLRRYKAFVIKKNFNSAADLVTQMDEKFPDSGITEYCKADMHLNVFGYYGWLQYAGGGGKYDYPEIFWCGVKETAGHEKKCGMFEDAEFELDEMLAAYDEFEKLSDDEIIDAADKNRLKLSDGSDAEIDLRYVYPMDSMGVGKIFPNSREDDYEEDFDEKAFARERDHFYFTGRAHDFYSRAEYCARKSLKDAKKILTEEECVRYKDFIASVDEKYAKFKSLIERRKKAKERLLPLNERVEKINRKERKAEFRKAKTKKFLKRFIIVAVVVAAAFVGYILIKRFL